MTRLFTSESVSDGHPDKICDQISDAILDECLRQDPLSRVAVETMVKSDLVVVAGEITTNAVLDFHHIIREVLTRIGYDDPQWGFDPWQIKVLTNITEQSPEIARSVIKRATIGAGDQGMMFGYAVKETPELMPLPIQAAHNLMRVHKAMRVAQRKRRTPDTPLLGPDAKAQITVRYSDDKPLEFDTVVLSVLHDSNLDGLVEYTRSMIENWYKTFGYDQYVTGNTKILINPAGPWLVGGPKSDAGVTGRKIIVDTYGGAARHGGGAFSGKDPTKVDRSAAYAARHLAKFVCSHPDLSRHRAEVQISYAIGIPDPISVHVYGMQEEAVKHMLDHFKIDLTPAGIIDRFNLRQPMYRQTAAFGHFGRSEFPWEQVSTS